MRLTLLFTLILFSTLIAQNDTTFSFDMLKVDLKGNKLEVRNPSEIQIFEKSFNDPSVLSSDLDADGLDELLIIDAFHSDKKTEYDLYIYSASEGFKQITLIHSGYVEPFIQYTTESENEIIITGNQSFNYLNRNSTENYYPLFCWKLSEGKIEAANNDLYDIFISENEDIIESLISFFEKNPKNCTSTMQTKNAICAVYLNFISAGESMMAQQFLNNFYYCDDSTSFKSEIERLFKKEY